MILHTLKMINLTLWVKVTFGLHDKHILPNVPVMILHSFKQTRSFCFLPSTAKEILKNDFQLTKTSLKKMPCLKGCPHWMRLRHVTEWIRSVNLSNSVLLHDLGHTVCVTGPTR